MIFSPNSPKMPKPENRPTIAVDVDDVLADEKEDVRKFINKTYNLKLTPEDYMIEAPYGRYFEKVWGVDGEKGLQMYEAYFNAGIKAKHKPVKGSVEAISKLEKKYNFVVVTSRGDRSFEYTHSWLSKHFPKVFKEVAFVPLWSKDKEITKAEICNEIGASYLVDDNAEHCNLAQKAGVQALLFGQYGWNRNVELTKGIIRVKDWQEVLEYFDGKG